MPLTPEDFSTTCVGDNLWTLFHRVWGMAKDSSAYDKATLHALDLKLRELQKLAMREPLDRCQMVRDGERCALTRDHCGVCYYG